MQVDLYTVPALAPLDDGYWLAVVEDVIGNGANDHQ
jgi:hypothetical protein